MIGAGWWDAARALREFPPGRAGFAKSFKLELQNLHLPF
jgi:hypothetical protein